MLYAHTLEGRPPDQWQPLAEHLQKVAAGASSRAAVFGAADWGRQCGLSHDAGKALPDFQQRLLGTLRRLVDHKGPGARWLLEHGEAPGLLLAYCVAGHHGGLPDFHNSGRDGAASLRQLCARAVPLPEVATPDADLVRVLQPPFAPTPFGLSFFTRLLFSALVDADYTDTEAFTQPAKAAERQKGASGAPPLEALATALDAHCAGFSPTGRVNVLRAAVLESCRKGAALAPGLFSLTVPTGGGKTLSSMSFALRHALAHGLRRVVYVIPYTSIIEQNARVFREIFPEGAVIEHHSNLDPRVLAPGADTDTVGESPAARRHRLACENWDAPVVVTTNVQFFESLFAAKPSRCRKLHNLARSVIVLDEAQMLPTDYLLPCLRALEELAAHYGCSIVFCTATQPALAYDPTEFKKGLRGAVRELAPDPTRLQRDLARTRLELLDEPLGLENLAGRLRQQGQVLCIVNTRQRAAELFRLLQDQPGARHLSALMCPAHRSRVLEDIRGQLREGAPCLTVSTQLVEAGVDVSFPRVFRELAGLDSLVQAAGRCNREGECDGLAPVTVFTPEGGVPRAFRYAADSAREVLRHVADPFSPEALHRYFRTVYWKKEDSLDSKGILDLLSDPKGQWFFRSAAQAFHFIENAMLPIVIPYDATARELLAALPFAEHPRGILRQLQQYTVQVYEGQFQALDLRGALEWPETEQGDGAGGCAVLADMDFYDERLGLVCQAPTAEDFIF